MNKQVLVDYIGSIDISLEQINESMAKNDGQVIVSGVMQRGDAFNQNQRKSPTAIQKN